jgi:hypothetical protein
VRNPLPELTKRVIRPKRRAFPKNQENTLLEGYYERENRQLVGLSPVLTGLKVFSS